MILMFILRNKYSVVFLLGALSSMVFAPSYLFFLGIVAFSLVFLFLDKAKKNKEAFLIGYWFGFGQFLFGFYWISISLFVDFEKFFWLLPFSLFAIPGLMAIYIGLVGLATNYLANFFSANKWQKFLLFSLTWLFFEWLRSVLFTGFPWNLIGYSFGFSNALLQTSSLFGVYGLSLLAITFYSSGALLFKLKKHRLSTDLSRGSVILFMVLMLTFLIAYFYGYYRLKNAKTELITDRKIRLVQPNIKQDNQRSQEALYQTIVENIRLSTKKSLADVGYVIWSESAVPFVIDRNSDVLLKEIVKAVPDNGFLISGAMRADFRKDLPHKVIDKIWNSIFVVDKSARVVAYYDKNHLVPFGEYVPFEKYIPFVSKITDGGGVGFSTGDGLKTIKLSDSMPSFSPLICYEAIFPDRVIASKSPPQFLLNLTNDAWFGDSSGPYQHFDMVKLRAIEYGLPLIRVANTGISALVDPYGRVIDKVDLNQQGFIDVALMKNLDGTFYRFLGNRLLIVIIFIIFVFSVIPLNPGKNHRDLDLS